MKLLFDQNLSPQLVSRLIDIFPGSEHVFNIELDRAEDVEICQYAVSHVFVVVTKDADYSELLTLKQTSPAIIWIRKGNCSTSAVEKLLREHLEQIKYLSVQDGIRLLMLF